MVATSWHDCWEHRLRYRSRTSGTVGFVGTYITPVLCRCNGSGGMHTAPPPALPNTLQFVGVTGARGNVRRRKRVKCE